MKSTVLVVCVAIAALTIVSIPRFIPTQQVQARPQSEAQSQPQNKEDKTLSPYFYVQGDPSVDHLPLKDTHVQIDVSGVIVDVQGVETYKKKGRRTINKRSHFRTSPQPHG